MVPVNCLIWTCAVCTAFFALAAVATAVSGRMLDCMALQPSANGTQNRGITKRSCCINARYPILILFGGASRRVRQQPGSIRVKPGDHVRQGQALAFVGNSGNSTEPHLHFQVSDGIEPMAGEGLPFVFDSFYRNGKLIQAEMPLSDWVMQFR